MSGFGSVSRPDATGTRIVATIRTPGTGEHSHIAVGDRSLWVTATTRGVVYRIDPRTNRVIAKVHLAQPVQGIAVGAGRVWVTQALQGPGQLIAIDPHSDRVTRPPIGVGPGPGQLVYGLHDLWVQNTSPASVMRVNPASGRVTTVIATTPVAPGSPQPGTIAVGYGSLWSLANGSLTRVDPVTDRVLWSTPVPRGGGGRARRASSLGARLSAVEFDGPLLSDQGHGSALGGRPGQPPRDRQTDPAWRKAANRNHGRRRAPLDRRLRQLYGHANLPARPLRIGPSRLPRDRVLESAAS